MRDLLRDLKRKAAHQRRELKRLQHAYQDGRGDKQKLMDKQAEVAGLIADLVLVTKFCQHVETRCQQGARFGA